MRFKIGSIVEVMTMKKMPLGAWRCAEIVSDNGDSYTVRFYRGRGIPKDGVEKVKTEDIRPSAPSIGGCIKWNVGDVVEVLDDGYWKVSMIEEVLEDDYYQIRVIGSIDEFRVKKASIRARQEWKENKWALMEKDSGDCEDMISRMRKKTRMQQQHCVFNLQLYPDSASLSNSLKRSTPDSSSDSDANLHPAQKRRVVNIPDEYSFIGKVAIITNPMKNNERDHLKHLTDTTSIATASKQTNYVGNLSSVASCSVMDAISERGLSHTSAGCSQGDDSLCSDAESLNIWGHKKGVSVSISNWENTLRSHDLDLRSYRYILETLFASGPLTWDQEVLLTDLRMKFDVSNDEHLTELRRLKCVGGLGLMCH